MQNEIYKSIETLLLVIFHSRYMLILIFFSFKIIADF